MIPPVRMGSHVVAGCLLTALAATVAHGQEIRSPSQYLGIEVGADRVVADYRQIRSYFAHLDEVSPRVRVDTLGETTLGEPMILAAITSEANMQQLDRLKEVARALADPRGLSDADIESLVREGRAIVIVVCNIHSDEIASSQMAMEWAHALAVAEDPETRRRLDEVVVLLVPSANPDGQIMEVEWYRRWLGTPYEGADMPWLYHHYVGHDLNRDWFMITQAETRHLTRVLYHEWLPQVLLDEHQMGMEGPRMFVPPFADPMDPDVDPLIWREIDLIGTTMAFRLELAGKRGVIYGYSYDAYWIGGTRNTVWWKNMTGLLTEVASARFATPVTVDPVELEGGRKGLPEYQAKVNHPNPWRGGRWSLRDIIDYERIASDAFLEAVADHREDVLRNMAARARRAAAEATPGEAYRIRGGLRDGPSARLLSQLMADHGLEVHETPDGDFWIPLGQPYARFVRELFERQRYPEVEAAPGEVLAPYDVAAWTLPLMMGVEVERDTLPAGLSGRRLAPSLGRRAGTPPGPPAELVDAPYYAVARTSPEAAKVIQAGLAQGVAWAGPASDPTGWIYLDTGAARAAAGTAGAVGVRLEPRDALPSGAVRLRRPRVGVYQPWTASMDEGWTRFVLEAYGFEVEPLDNDEVRRGALARSYDAIVIPDLDKAVIDSGAPKREEGAMRYRPPRPPGYRGGLDDEGAEAIRAFVEAGGTLIAFDSAAEWVIDELNLPVRNALAKAARTEFNAPGSLLRAYVERGHPVTAGLPDSLAVFLDDATAFETAVPGAELERHVLLRYPTDGRDVLLSGWIRGEEKLERKGAAVATSYGEGRVVLLGFRPQHRAQTHVTFPLLFNALWWSTAH